MMWKRQKRGTERLETRNGLQVGADFVVGIKGPRRRIHHAMMTTTFGSTEGSRKGGLRGTPTSEIGVACSRPGGSASRSSPPEGPVSVERTE